MATRQKREVEQLRAALREGELSGEPAPFDPEEFKKSMAAAHGEVEASGTQGERA